MSKVIPHFEKFPLLSGKKEDFELFKKVCEMVNKKHHLSKDGFIKLVHLAYQMNGSGKRKRNKEEIIQSLK
jgi:hypothetical protein